MIPLKGTYSDSVIIPSLLPEEPTPELKEFLEREFDMTKLFKLERWVRRQMIMAESLTPTNKTNTTSNNNQKNTNKAHLSFRTYQFNFLPVGIFPRLLSRMFQAPGLYCYGASRGGFLMVPTGLLTSFGVKSKRKTMNPWSM